MPSNMEKLDARTKEHAVAYARYWEVVNCGVQVVSFKEFLSMPLEVRSTYLDAMEVIVKQKEKEAAEAKAMLGVGQKAWFNGADCEITGSSRDSWIIALSADLKTTGTSLNLLSVPKDMVESKCDAAFLVGTIVESVGVRGSRFVGTVVGYEYPTNKVICRSIKGDKGKDRKRYAWSPKELQPVIVDVLERGEAEVVATYQPSYAQIGIRLGL